MALDVSGLPAYVDQNSDSFLSLAVVGSKTGQYCGWQTGIKGSEALQIFETDAVFQADTGCGWNSSGTTTLTQKTISVAKTKVQENICISDLEGKWSQNLLRPGSPDENGVVPAFEEVFFREKAKKIAKQNELGLWQGDTGSGTAYLARFNGWLKLLDTAADFINGNPSGITVATGITTGNIEGIVDTMYQKIPEQLLDKEDLFVGMSWAHFRTWVAAIKNSNYFNYAVDTKNGEAIIPGTNVKVIALPGLSGSNRIVAGSWSNFIAGTDMMDEADKMEFYYAKEAETWRFSCKWKLGAQIAFTSEVVMFVLVP